MSRKFMKKQFFSAALAAAMSFSGANYTVYAQEASVSSFAEKFASPKAENTISTRWWIPGAAVTEEEIRREVQLLAEEGFANVEMVYFPLSVDGRFTVSAEYGWDTEAWKNVLKWAFDEGEKQGVKINLTTGPMWPSMSPLITPDDDAAEKERNFGVIRVPAGETFEGMVPKPDASAEESVTKEELVAVTVAKVNNYEQITEESFNFFAGGMVETTKEGYTLDTASLEDITTMVTDADTEETSVSWTAPEDGDYLLFGFWQRGTGQVGNANSKGMIASNPQSYCIDHLSSIGVDALTDYWDMQFLSDDEIRSYIEANNPEFFEDSLELIHTLLWTPKMLGEFENLRGYSMAAYLPLLYGSVDKDTQGGGEMNAVYSFTTEEENTDDLFVKDYQQTISDLYVENHIKPLAQWCDEVGLTYKTQSYGESIDTPLAYAYTDVPEGESLEYGEDNYNAFRAVAASSHMTGKNYVSAEYGAVMGSGFEITWDDLLITFNKIASAGVNRVILHGFPYEDYQGSDSQNPDTVVPWPGFDPFNDLFADHWNSHVPSWEFMDIYTDYISRVQTVLQEGNAALDLAVYADSKEIIEGPYYENEFLSNKGYTYDLVSPSLMEASGASVAENQLITDSVSYGALVIGNQIEMTVDTAKMILSYAESGLPVYFVGETPSAVPTLNEQESKNQELLTVMEKIYEQASVKRLTDEEELAAKLKEDGIMPSAAYEKDACVYNAQRISEDAHYYFFNNAGETSVSMKVDLAGEGVPYLLDAWTGEITPIAHFEKTDNGVAVSLNLECNEAKIIAVAQANTLANTTFSDETVVTAEGADLPEAIELKDQLWDLSVESWTAGEAEEGDTSGNNTKKTTLDTISTKLVGWEEIEGLKDVSGIGTYTTTVNIDGWDEATNSYLEIGDTIDNIIGIQVNGTDITRLEQLVQKYDLENLLKNGENTIVIRIATTLNNAVNAIGEYVPIFGDGAQPQNYGLTGNVTIVPYEKAEIK